MTEKHRGALVRKQPHVTLATGIIMQSLGDSLTLVGGNRRGRHSTR